MKKKLRIAVLGAGRWGKNIIATLKTLSDCEIAYIEAEDYRTLIEKKDIDAIIVATPGSTHAKVALSFVKKGLPVFIEKPMTTSVLQAELLAREVKKSGALVFVGHIHLYNPAYLKVKELIRKIGRIRYIYAEGSSNGPYRDDMSALWDWAPHDVSMMLDLLRTFPTSVEAWKASSLRPNTKLHDAAFVKLNFEAGVTGFIFNTWLFPEKRKKITIVGEKSSIVFDDTIDKKISFYKNMGPDVKGDSVIWKKPIMLYPRFDGALPLTKELKAFLAMARTNKKPKTDIHSGLAVVSILEAAEKSMTRNGRPVSIKNKKLK